MIISALAEIRTDQLNIRKETAVIKPDEYFIADYPDINVSFWLMKMLILLNLLKPNKSEQ